MVEMLSLLYLFATNRPALVDVSAERPAAEFAAPASATNGFTIAFRATLRRPEKPQRLIDVPGVAEVTLRMRDRSDGDMRLNYCSFRLPDGSLPVVEATVFLTSAQHPDWKQMTVGFPLGCLKEPYGAHDFVLNFSGVRWALYADGELMDLDFPYGYPDWAAAGAPALKIDASAVRGARLFAPALQAEAKPKRPQELKEVQYWTPHGFNTWVGDVATCYFKGRYHVFYLLDRRHHSSKFGQGSHYFEHLSTADFKTWTEHEAAAPIDEQWECIGTGTPFAFNGKLCLAYGLHTERIFPDEKTTRPAQSRYLEAHGCTGTFTREAPGAPVGSTYSISADGVSKFKKTWNFFHTCRNPSVYIDPAGQLRMLANSGSRGTWVSDAVDGGWRCTNADFPPGGDCTFFFRWGRFDYIVGGFVDFWAKPADAPESAYDNVVHKGLDCYDGLNVPCVTEVGKGRFVLAGWTQDYGWGGHLALRELVQFPDGRLGSKWLPEAVPAIGPVKALNPIQVNAPEKSSFLLSFKVAPKTVGQGRVAVDLSSAAGTCRFEIDLSANRAQFAPVKEDGSSERQKSLREGCSICGTRQYAIENLIATDKPFQVRLIVKNDPKSSGSMVDAEIAGCRTMLGFWPNLSVSGVSFNAGDVELKNVEMASLK